MKCRLQSNNIFTSGLMAVWVGIVSSLYAAAAGAFLGIGDPKVEVVIPSQIAEGGVVPIYVRADNFESDPIKSISLLLEGNPVNQQRAFVLNLEKPRPMVFISTRIRLSSAGVSPITVRVTQLSGQVLTRSFQTGYVGKPVDFLKPDTLNVVYQGSFVFPKDELGQPQLRVSKKKGDTSELEIRGLLHHPMLPSTKSDPGLFINSVDFFYENENIGTFETGPALSNDPFLQLSIKDNRSVGVAKMVWKDVQGHSFETTK